MRALLKQCVTGVAFALAIGTAGGASADTIKIGFIGPLSGSVAVYGSEPLEAARFALEEIHASGMLGEDEIELVVADSTANPGQAAQAAQRMIISDDVLMIIGGHTSAETQAIMEVTRGAEVPQLSSLAQDSALTAQGNPWFARIAQSALIWGDATAQWLAEQHGAKKVYMLGRNDNYGRSLSEAIGAGLEKRGVEVLGPVYYEPQNVEFKPLLVELQQANPDFVVINGFYTDTGLVVKQMGELGISTPYYNNTAPAVPQFQEIAGPNAEGAYGAAYYLAGSIGSPEANAFLEKWREKYGRDPSQYEGMGYDVMHLVADAIVRAKESGELSRQSVRDAIYATKDYPGATGSITILENGDVQRPLPFFQLQGGVPTLDHVIE